MEKLKSSHLYFSLTGSTEVNPGKVASWPPIFAFKSPVAIVAAKDTRLNVKSSVTLVASDFAAFLTLPKFTINLSPSTLSIVWRGGKYATVPVFTISTLAGGLAM